MSKLLLMHVPYHVNVHNVATAALGAQMHEASATLSPETGKSDC